MFPCSWRNRIVLYDTFILGAGRPKRWLREINGLCYVFFTHTHTLRAFDISDCFRTHTTVNSIYVYIFVSNFYKCPTVSAGRFARNRFDGNSFHGLWPFLTPFHLESYTVFASNSTNRFCCQKSRCVSMFLYAYGA